MFVLWRVFLNRQRVEIPFRRGTSNLHDSDAPTTRDPTIALHVDAGNHSKTGGCHYPAPLLISPRWVTPRRSSWAGVTPYAASRGLAPLALRAHMPVAGTWRLLRTRRPEAVPFDSRIRWLTAATPSTKSEPGRRCRHSTPEGRGLSAPERPAARTSRRSGLPEGATRVRLPGRPITRPAARDGWVGEKGIPSA